MLRVGACFEPAFHVQSANTLKREQTQAVYPLPLASDSLDSLVWLLCFLPRDSCQVLSWSRANGGAFLAHVLLSFRQQLLVPLTCLGDLHSCWYLLGKPVSLLKECILRQVPVLNARRSRLKLFSFEMNAHPLPSKRPLAV